MNAFRGCSAGKICSSHRCLRLVNFVLRLFIKRNNIYIYIRAKKSVVSGQFGAFSCRSEAELLFIISALQRINTIQYNNYLYI